MGPAMAQRSADTFKLYFDLNVDKLNKTSEKKIDLLIYNDKIISGINITIVGYADYLGSEEYNKDLSMRRAQNVKDYLVKNGVAEKDISVCMGKGKVERNMTGAEGYQIDRRVDIVVNNSKGKPGKPGRPRKDTGRKFVTSVDQIANLRPGSILLLKNVYFPHDSHVIKPESAETLEKLFAVLRDNPGLKVSIEGHVCCVHAPDALDEDTNEPTLSVNRARAIYDYLVRKGIDPKRLTYTGFGHRRPVVAVELTEADAEQNRRVEIRVTENNRN